MLVGLFCAPASASGESGLIVVSRVRRVACCACGALEARWACHWPTSAPLPWVVGARRSHSAIFETAENALSNGARVFLGSSVFRGYQSTPDHGFSQLPRCTGMYSHSRDAGHPDL